MSTAEVKITLNSLRTHKRHIGLLIASFFHEKEKERKEKGNEKESTLLLSKVQNKFITQRWYGDIIFVLNKN